MNRNTQEHFAQVPTVNIGRSKFNRSFTHKTTWNTSELIPVYVDPDIVPGDTVTMRQAELVRMMTPIAPVMDNCYLDFYWFFVPNRLVWDHFKRFMGENDTTPWTQTIEYTIPQIKIKNTSKNTIDGEDYLTKTVEKGSVLDHMGIPTQPDWNYAYDQGEVTREIKISSLPTKAYVTIWNEFFRDENLQNPCLVQKNDSDLDLVNSKNANYLADEEAGITTYSYMGGLKPLKVCKAHDYFTSCLPGAQKGPAVALPLSDEKLKIELGQKLTTTGDGGWIDGAQTGAIPVFSGTSHTGVTVNQTVANVGKVDEDGSAGLSSEMSEVVSGSTLWPQYNLVADLTKATGATVTALRQAFAIQKFYERDARGGTRYIESVKSHFGVTNPDFRLQRPEYLGGFRQNINMNQVVQSSPLVENTETTPLGTTGAFSVTSHQNADVFTHSFTEHGILMGLCCIRTDHTYQQGINRAWTKKKRLDFYSPEFANLSEQAVLNKEIYAQGTNDDDEAFGYQECWAEMRYMPDLVSGEMRSNYAQSLDIWHYADYYTEKPTLGDKWIQETNANVERTLAIQTHDQFMGDFYFDAIYTRPMPLYSIPGLIDHH